MFEEAGCDDLCLCLHASSQSVLGQTPRCTSCECPGVIKECDFDLFHSESMSHFTQDHAT